MPRGTRPRRGPFSKSWRLRAAPRADAVSNGALNSTEADDTLSAAAAILVLATGSLTEADDSLVGTGVVLVTGTAAITEAGDTLAAAGVVLVAGTSALSEAADSLSSSGVALISCTATLTEADDSLAATGVVLVQAAEASTEAADAIAAASAVLVQASAALTEDADTLSAAGTVQDTLPINGDAALLEADDVVAGFGVAAFPFSPASTMSWPIAPSKRGRRRPPAITAVAVMVEDADGVSSDGTVSWPLRASRVRDDEWLLRRAA